LNSNQQKPKNKPGAGWEDDDDAPLPSLKPDTKASNDALDIPIKNNNSQTFIQVMYNQPKMIFLFKLD